MPRPKNTTTTAPPTSTSAPTLSTRLHELISACLTGIWVQTHEPHEAARELTSLCRPENWRLGKWNCDSGIQFPIEQIAIPGVVRVRPACGSGTPANLHRQAPRAPWHTSTARARQPDLQDENR